MKRLLLVTCLLLSACGQKGPLYFPQDDTATSSSALVMPSTLSSNTSAA